MYVHREKYVCDFVMFVYFQGGEVFSNVSSGKLIEQPGKGTVLVIETSPAAW